jgi:hypothetical protein
MFRQDEDLLVVFLSQPRSQSAIEAAGVDQASSPVYAFGRERVKMLVK